jgi:hypothetical protein
LFPIACESLARLNDVGYVSAGPEPSDDPVAVTDWRGARLEPAIRAISSTNPEFGIVLVRPSNCRQPALPDPLAILGMNNFVEPGEA